jgi:hypothetical protein
MTGKLWRKESLARSSANLLIPGRRHFSRVCFNKKEVFRVAGDTLTAEFAELAEGT